MFETLEAKGEITKEKTDRSHCTEELEERKKSRLGKIFAASTQRSNIYLTYAKFLSKGKKKLQQLGKLKCNYKATQGKVLFFLLVSEMSSIKISIETILSWTNKE